jgi:para-nitrobenzyl esterase
LTQVPLSGAEAFSEQFASQVGCADQTAACLRSVPVATLLGAFPGAAIPGVIDGKVLKESIGAALAAGRFAHVPVLNGTNHDEERLFVAGLGVAVSGGMFVGVPKDTYQNQIAAVLGVSNTRAAAIAAEYPLNAYSTQTIALSTLVADANFACPAYQVDTWISQRAPAFAYEFNDDNAPPRLAPPVATHTSELPYLFDLPNAHIQAPFTTDQETLAANMRSAWASFAASGDPSTASVPWPSFEDNAQVMSLVPPQPQVEADFATNHHCSFWAAG